MMKYFLLIVFVFLASVFNINNIHAQGKLNAYSKALVHAISPYLEAEVDSRIPEEIIEKYMIRTEEGQNHLISTSYVKGIIKTNGVLSSDDLKRNNIKIGSKTGDIWTVKVPLSKLKEFTNQKGIQFIEFDQRMELFLDNARADCGVDDVHSGLDLPQAHKGNGVIVGVIDQGYDFNHPTFKDANGDLRIKKVWLLGDNTSSPPAGFDYGSEFATVDEILQKQTDVTFGLVVSHGSHVSGIAAGQGDGIDNTYAGVAPEADIVLCTYTEAGSEVLDAINYIYDIAEAEGKPAVINMSFGTYIGPKDGTSLKDQAFMDLTGPGRLLVGACGNAGSTPLHVSHTFSSDTVKTVALMGLFGSTTIDIWGDVNKDYEVGFVAIDASGNIIGQSSKSYNPNMEPGNFTEDFNGITLEIAAVSKNETTNQKANLLIQASGSNASLGIWATGADGIIHMWNNGFGQGANFADSLAGGTVMMDGYTHGDSEYSMAENSGTSEAVITAGAYTTKNSYTNIDGQTQNIAMMADEGDYAPFSSRGPTTDGRTKPDISAPGNVVASAFSNHDFFATFSGTVVHQINEGGVNYPFGVYEGTSMASPMVTGACALMLEVAPSIDPNIAREILKKTARIDEWTGDLPEEGTPYWGWGKLNVYDAVKESYNYTNRLESEFASGVLVYPNPSKAEFYIRVLDQTVEINQVSCTDLIGNQVKLHFQRTGSVVKCNTNELSAGVYVLQIQDQTGALTNKRLIVH